MANHTKDMKKIECFQFYIDPMPDWFMDKLSTNEVTMHKEYLDRFTVDEVYCSIKKHEGIEFAKSGDYIIKGVQGELIPCPPEDFHATYEQVGD